MNIESTELEPWMVSHWWEATEQTIKFIKNLGCCANDDLPMKQIIMLRQNLVFPLNDEKQNEQRRNLHRTYEGVRMMRNQMKRE